MLKTHLSVLITETTKYIRNKNKHHQHKKGNQKPKNQKKNNKKTKIKQTFRRGLLLLLFIKISSS